MVSFFQYVIYFIVHIPLKFFLKPKVILETGTLTNPKKPYIIAANHLSRFDALVLLLLPFSIATKFVPVYFLITERYYNKWWLKPIMKMIGGLQVKSWAWTFDDFLGEGLRELRQDHTVMIFPEGRITRNDLNATAKPGIIYLAKKSKVQILPLQITGTSGINFLGSIMRKKTITLKLGPPTTINKSANDKVNYIKAADKIVNLIHSL